MRMLWVEGGRDSATGKCSQSVLSGSKVLPLGNSKQGFWKCESSLNNVDFNWWVTCGVLWEKPLKKVFSGCFVEFGSLRSFSFPDKLPTVSHRILELKDLILSYGN